MIFVRAGDVIWTRPGQSRNGPVLPGLRQIRWPIPGLCRRISPTISGMGQHYSLDPRFARPIPGMPPCIQGQTVPHPPPQMRPMLGTREGNPGMGQFLFRSGRSAGPFRDWRADPPTIPGMGQHYSLDPRSPGPFPECPHAGNASSLPPSPFPRILNPTHHPPPAPGDHRTWITCPEPISSQPRSGVWP